VLKKSEDAMQMRSLAKSNLFVKRLLATATLAGVFLLAGTPRAAAYDDGCYRRTARAEHKLHEAIEHHGYNSRQAGHWRHELHEARESCWRERHQWWNEHEHRWHHDHDWDDRDHDRD
jgi:hypothetical protein